VRDGDQRERRASNGSDVFSPDFQGVCVPLYLTQHTLACLTRQGADALIERMQAGQEAKAERVMVNMLDGKMFVEFRADSREVLEAWLQSQGMHFDTIVRIEWESRGGKLQQV
jgi:hypothetical protein